MTNRLMLFKWRARARRIAETATDPEVQAVATQFQDSLNAAFMPNEDRWIIPKGDMPDLVYWAWLLIKSRPVQIRRRMTLLDMLNPTNVPEPEWRVKALVNLFNGLAAGTYIATPQIQQVFRRTATDDPDPRVRAWAHFLIDPKNHPRPHLGCPHSDLRAAHGGRGDPCRPEGGRAGLRIRPERDEALRRSALPRTGLD